MTYFLQPSWCNFVNFVHTFPFVGDKPCCRHYGSRSWPILGIIDPIPTNSGRCHCPNLPHPELRATLGRRFGHMQQPSSAITIS